jgi:hypothetical protein
VGKWLNDNGESIYGTNASPFKKLDWGKCTQKRINGRTRLYLHIFGWPNDGKLVLPGIYNKPINAFFLTDENKSAMVSGAMSKHIASSRIHYRLPEGNDEKWSSFQCPYNYLEFKESRDFLRFATCVSLFGSMLRNSDYVKNITWQDLVNMTFESADQSDNLQKEFYEMVVKAQKIYQPIKKKNK